MTFGAMAAWQAWLLMAAAVAAAVAVFRLKVRPPAVIVPSIAVWRRVVDELRAASWWERVRRAVSLVLTAIIALALALGVTRPGPGAAAAADGRVLIVLDTSWSMRARTADGRTRWQHAVAGAQALVRSNAGGELALATTADGLVEGPTSDAALVATALARLAPAGGDSAAWPRLDALTATHFFTDGAVARTLAPAVVVHSVYEPAPNVAVIAFSARPATSAAASAEAYLDVANYADARQSVHIAMTRDAAVIVDRTVEMGAGEALRQIVPLAALGGPRLGVHVSASGNALDVDDDAVAWLPSADPIRVRLVSDRPGALAALLARDAAVQVSAVRPAAYAAEDAGADVLIFDGWTPDAPPGRPALYLAPPSSAWLRRSVNDEAAPRWRASSDHPVLEGVDPFTLEIARARAYEAANLEPIAVSERGTPLVSVLDTPKTRAVVIGFGIEESNLPVTPAFPVLVGNALEWLAHPASGEPATPGPLALGASTTQVIAPDGAIVPLVRAGDRVLVNLRAPGLYAVEAGGSRRVIGVNIGRPDIANLMHTTQPAAPGTARPALGYRPWWTAALAAALVLLVLEWFTWQRRVTV
jgi:hypothetical protein